MQYSRFLIETTIFLVGNLSKFHNLRLNFLYWRYTAEHHIG